MIKRSRLEPWTWLLLAVSAVVGAFMATHHDFVPMWIEGLPEYEHQIRAALGCASRPGDCGGFSVGRHFFSLGVNAYVGAVNTYLDLPGSSVWLTGISDDPYFYRYSTVPALLASVWLFYFLLRRRYGAPPAFYGAVTLLVCPIVLLVGLTDHRLLINQTLFVLAALFLGDLYWRSRRPGYLWAACLVAGLSSWMRTDTFVVFSLPLLAYSALFLRRKLTQFWRALPARRTHVYAAAAGLLLGTAPVLAYNLQCPGSGLVRLLLDRSAPNLMHGSIGEKLLVRLNQFASFNLLSQEPLYGLRLPNLALAAAFIVAAIVVLNAWFRSHRPDYPLFALFFALPLFVFSSSGLRELHLHLLEPAVVAVIVAGGVQAASRRRWVMHAFLGSVALGSAVTAVSDWQAWQRLSPDKQTMLNQSDPPLLVAYLKKHYSNDELLFTNIGFTQYVEYVSRGSLSGRDIMNWFSPADFEHDVRAALCVDGKRRVFVAVSPERDGSEGTLSRTRLLYSVLNDTHIPYQVVRLRNARNLYLYDLVVVEPGTAPVGRALESVVVYGVSLNPPRDGLVTGTISGRGFREGDRVLLNGTADLPSVFGSESFITCAFPESLIGVNRPFRVEIMRPSSLGRSQAFEAPSADGGRR